MTPTLTIAIPTYNRTAKLERLLYALEAEIVGAGLERRVEILVSDNASPDDPRPMIDRFAARNGVRVSYHRQRTNGGFDRNLRFLFATAETDYVWFFGDDDLPLPGALRRVIGAIDSTAPDVLTFSFVQPPGADMRQYRYPEPVHVVTDPSEAARVPLAVLKLTVFVVRRRALPERIEREVERTLDAGWYFLALAYGILSASRRPTVAVISDPLATSDDDFDKLEWAPVSLPQMYQALQNEFVLRHAPDEIERRRAGGYYAAIQFCFAAKVGNLRPTCPEEYEAFFRRIPLRPLWLLKNPKVLLQYLLLMAGFAHRLAPIWALRRR